MAAIPTIVELNIGHFLIGEAIFGGLDGAIRRMRALMDQARAGATARSHPMILGIGSDLIDIRRIERTLERFGDRFVERIFTADRARARPSAAPTARRATPSASPPRRPAPRRSAPASAAACSGATSASSICLGGQPTLALTGGALARLEAHHRRRA